MLTDDLKEILRLHSLWLSGDTTGVRANLCEANLRGANLRGVDLRGANLRGVDLRGVDLRWANLRGANLRGANLYGANLYEANLYGADLYGANLRWANLRGANLRGANLLCCGDSRFIKTMQIDTWSVGYTSDTMQIGCQRHRIEEWWSFSDDEISEMDARALEWWIVWKPILKSIISASPAESTGAKEDV